MNFFLIGKPGSGKSTFINVVCREKKAMEMSWGGITSNKILKYFIGDSSIALFDTPGFNSRFEINSKMKEIENKIKEIYDDKEQIHAIFYMINSSLVRTLDEGEINFIRIILKF